MEKLFSKKSLKESIKKNKEDRRWWIKYWANYVRTHPDKVWSRQQNILINSVIRQ